MHEEKFESVKMRHALSDIAKEIQKFNCSNMDSPQHHSLFIKINSYKVKLRMKKNQMKHLIQSLRILSVVAKLLVSLREKNNQTLKRDFMYGHIGSAHVLSTFNSCLIRDNQNRCEDSHTDLEKLINNSYLKLKKKYDEIAEECSIQDKLKGIIFYCDLNWTNLCTERSKCEILEQRNRYLTNKINILETNLKSIADKQKYCRCEGFVREKNKMKYIEPRYQYCANIEMKRSLNEDHYTNNNNEIQGMNNFERDTQYTNLSLKRHLILVKSILIDQNDLLEELKKLSDELDKDCA